MKNDKSDKMAIDIAETIEEVSHKCLATKCVSCKVNGKRVLAKTVLRCRSNLIAYSLMDKGCQKQIVGEWIKDEESKFEHRYHCSVCNFYLMGTPTKYCEDCGAYMKGGAE